MLVTEPPEEDDESEALFPISDDQGADRSPDLGKEGGLKDQRPLFINALMESPARREMLDYFLTEAEPNKPVSKAEIARSTDISRTSVVKHVEIMVELGIAEAIGEERHRYLPNTDSTPFQLCVRLNEALAAHYHSDD